MSDTYTPSTDDVRDAYAERGSSHLDRRKWYTKLRFARFDRWLAAERARIWAEGAAYVLEGYAIPGDPSDANPYKDGAA